MDVLHGFSYVYKLEADNGREGKGRVGKHGTRDKSSRQGSCANKMRNERTNTLTKRKKRKNVMSD